MGFSIFYDEHQSVLEKKRNYLRGTIFSLIINVIIMAISVWKMIMETYKMKMCKLLYKIKYIRTKVFLTLIKFIVECWTKISLILFCCNYRHFVGIVNLVGHGICRTIVLLCILLIFLIKNLCVEESIQVSPCTTRCSFNVLMRSFYVHRITGCRKQAAYANFNHIHAEYEWCKE